MQCEPLGFWATDTSWDVIVSFVKKKPQVQLEVVFAYEHRVPAWLQPLSLPYGRMDAWKFSFPLELRDHFFFFLDRISAVVYFWTGHGTRYGIFLLFRLVSNTALYNAFFAGIISRRFAKVERSVFNMHQSLVEGRECLYNVRLRYWY